jgi:hypothetical protein
MELSDSKIVRVVNESRRVFSAHQCRDELTGPSCVLAIYELAGANGTAKSQ